MRHPSARLLARTILAALVMAAVPGLAHSASPSPSFDCRKAATATERLICADDDLAALDRRLGDAFRAVRQSAPDDRKAGLLQEQQRWLREVRDGCVAASGGKPTRAERSAAPACLSAAYRIRISALADEAPGTPTDTGRTAPEPATEDARLTLVRIQSALERVAGGRPATWNDQQADPLEAIAGAYARFLDADPGGMDKTLDEIGRTVASRLQASSDNPTLKDYVARLDAAASSPAALTRLLAGLRRVDGVLFLEAASPLEQSVDLKDRTVSGGFAYNRSRLDGTWLRLPCRTVIGRAGDFTAARLALGDSAGDLLSCPTDTADPAEMEALARDPSRFGPRPAAAPPAPQPPAAAPAAPPSPPWSREAAIAHMGERPDLARPVLEAAARTDALGTLDYALFLYAFDPDGAPRNAQIGTLLNRLVGLAKPEDEPPPPLAGAGPVDPERLVDVIRFASESSIANSDSAFYAIPCAILLARPELLAAIEPYYGSNRDNFLPRSGCAWGRGAIDGFPEQEVRAYLEASEAADGDFIDNFDGSMKFGLISGREATLQAIAVAPAGFLDEPEPVLDFPYQTWGATGLVAHEASLRIRTAYEQALARLAAYGNKRGMTEADAARAARTALFRLVFGAECGDAAPGDSTRALLLAGAPAATVIARLDLDDEGESPAVIACSATAGLDPLEHVAVLNATVLEHLLIQGSEVDAGNDFGKTPLMAAAQFDRVDSARILLSRGAEVGAVTWQGPDPLGATLYHDARSALMYAAANASLPMIRLLLRAGADPYQADSKGRRAIDYLLGFGPAAPNPKLTPDERAEAVGLLY